MNLHRSRPRRGGFTLVELLVVIVVVGILAALLLPALSVAKARSQSIYCVNSLKQMGLSSKMYVDDNSSTFPWTYTLLGDQQERRTWFTYLEPYQQSGRLWLCPVRPKTIALAPIKISGFLQRSAEGEIIYPTDGTVVNYAANVFLGGFYEQGIQDNFAPLTESSVVRSPSSIVHISDSGSQAMMTTNEKLCVTPQSPAKHGAWILADPSSKMGNSAYAATDDPNWCGPQLRHLEKTAANVLFLDGRVETRPSKWYYAGTLSLRASGGNR